MKARSLVLTAAAAVALLALAPAAQAGGWNHDGPRWHHRGYGGPPAWRPYYPHWRPPVRYYPPPPAYYAPRPYAYAPPSMYFGFSVP